MNVARATPPVMRRQRAGHIITVASVTGLVVVRSSLRLHRLKVRRRGWAETIRYDIASYNIHTTIVERGFLRTELLVAPPRPGPSVHR